jgi:hypothetical protein
MVDTLAYHTYQLPTTQQYDDDTWYQIPHQILDTHGISILATTTTTSFLLVIITIHNRQ